MKSKLSFVVLLGFWLCLFSMIGFAQEVPLIEKIEVFSLNKLTQIYIQGSGILDYQVNHGKGFIEILFKGRLAEELIMPIDLPYPIQNLETRETVDGVSFYLFYSGELKIQNQLTTDQEILILSFMNSESAIPEEEELEREQFEVFFLNYADVTEVASIIKKLVPFGDRNIQVDEVQQALIVNRQIEEVDQIEKLIRKLDLPREQILIDAKIVEVNRDHNSTVGLDFSKSIGASFKEKTTTYGEVELELQTFVRTPINLMAAINLIKGQGQARVLANPRIATLSGVEAKVITQERIPIFITENVSGQNYRIKQDIVAGIQLKIEPKVNQHGEITSTIYTNVTSVTGTTADGYPTTSSREAETIIRSRAGETIIIGGLARESVIQYENRVPILGDIPILGRLFRTVRDENKRSDLYIFITPYLVTNEGQIPAELVLESEQINGENTEDEQER